MSADARGELRIAGLRAGVAGTEILHGVERAVQIAVCHDPAREHRSHTREFLEFNR